MIKYSVGFQLYDNGEEPFSEIVRSYVEHISEVFFAWQDVSTGRSAIATRHGYTDWSAQARTEEELRRIKGLGVRLDLLFNENCYGEYAISEKLANTVISVVEYLEYICFGLGITLKDFFNTDEPQSEIEAAVSKLTAEQKELLIKFINSL